MASQQIVCYAPAGFSDFLQTLSEIQGARLGQLVAQLTTGQAPKAEEQAHAMLTSLMAHKGKLKVPSFVLGFRLKDTKRAQAQLDRLQQLMDAIVKRAPPLEGRFKSQKVGGGNYLTLNLDGSLVPWDSIPFNRIEKNAGEFDDLVKKLK